MRMSDLQRTHLSEEDGRSGTSCLLRLDAGLSSLGAATSPDSLIIQGSLGDILASPVASPVHLLRQHVDAVVTDVPLVFMPERGDRSDYFARQEAELVAPTLRAALAMLKEGGLLVLRIAAGTSAVLEIVESLLPAKVKMRTIPLVGEDPGMVAICKVSGGQGKTDPAALPEDVSWAPDGVADLLARACPEVGLVLDPWAGEGLVGAAVIKLNAAAGSNVRFVLLEDGQQAVMVSETMRGQEMPFRYLRSAHEPVTNESLWGESREEMLISLQSSVSFSGHGFQIEQEYLPECRHLIGSKHNPKTDADEGVYLLWSADSSDPAQESLITEEVLLELHDEREREGLSLPYHVYARFNIDQAPTVCFTQLTVQNLYSLDEDRG